MTATATTYATWHTTPDADARMGDSHTPMWRHFIETLPERELRTKTVLDFGCNRGGFLRLLHAMRPFHEGIGVDIAIDSVAAANAARGALPVSYHVAEDLAAWRETIDVALSYEVIYLLPDLRQHAEQVFQALRPGASYYAVTGCHTECPIWETLRERIRANSNAPVQNYSPNDYADALAGAGFEVGVRRFGYADFVSAQKDRSYFPRVLDALDYYTRDKLLFRATKPVSAS